MKAEAAHLAELAKVRDEHQSELNQLLDVILGVVDQAYLNADSWPRFHDISKAIRSVDVMAHAKSAKMIHIADEQRSLAALAKVIRQCAALGRETCAAEISVGYKTHIRVEQRILALITPAMLEAEKSTLTK